MSDIETRYWARLGDDELVKGAKDVAYQLRCLALPNVSELVELLAEKLESVSGEFAAYQEQYETQEWPPEPAREFLDALEEAVKDLRDYLQLTE